MTQTAVKEALLAKRAATGDREAFATLVRVLGPRVAAIARLSGVTAADVEDVVQDSFIAAWRALADYDSSRSFKTWLFQIALNKSRDWRRRRRVRAFFYGAAPLDDPDALAIASASESPESGAHHRAMLDKVGRAVAELPDDLRRVFVLITVAELTYAEVAGELGINIKAVEGRLARARRALDPSLSKLVGEN